MVRPPCPFRRNGIQPDSNYLLVFYVPQDRDLLDYPLDLSALRIIITGRFQCIDPHLLDSPLLGSFSPISCSSQPTLPSHIRYPQSAVVAPIQRPQSSARPLTSYSPLPPRPAHPPSWIVLIEVPIHEGTLTTGPPIVVNVYYTRRTHTALSPLRCLLVLVVVLCLLPDVEIEGMRGGSVVCDQDFHRKDAQRLVHSRTLI
jgi:hypothetical protein